MRCKDLTHPPNTAPSPTSANYCPWRQKNLSVKYLFPLTSEWKGRVTTNKTKTTRSHHPFDSTDTLLKPFLPGYLTSSVLHEKRKKKNFFPPLLAHSPHKTQFSAAFVSLLSDGETPEIMLLACRAISHLLEALPGSAGPLCGHGAAAALCAKLLSIEYMDLAEQCLVALDKIRFGKLLISRLFAFFPCI